MEHELIRSERKTLGLQVRGDRGAYARRCVFRALFARLPDADEQKY